MRKLVAIIALSAALEAAFAFWAFGHGTHRWIDDRGYVNRNGQACCGLDDCRIVANDAVRIGPRGYEVVVRQAHHERRLVIPYADALVSADGAHRLCELPWFDRLTMDPPCFFAPKQGM